MKRDQDKQVNATDADANTKRRERLGALASETVGEGNRIELIYQYKGGFATELY